MEENYFNIRIKNLKYKNLNKIAEFPKNALIELTNSCNHAPVYFVRILTNNAGLHI